MQSPEKNVFILANRFMEIRYLINSGIIEELSKDFHIVMFVPKSSAQLVSKFFHKNVTVIASQFGKKYKNNFHRFVFSFLVEVFYFTLPNRDLFPNVTIAFKRKHHKDWSRRQRFSLRLLSDVTLLFARLASNNKTFRRVLQYLTQKCMSYDTHLSEFKKYSPDLVIACSCGLGLEDCEYTLLAKEHNVKVVTLVQGWDRTSSKGYPTVHSDYTFVWNDIMAQESEINLEFQKEQIKVTGVPSWDHHFTKEGLLQDVEWRTAFNIPEGKKVLFFATGGFASHQANMTVIPMILEALKDESFLDAHLIIRFYPLYYASVDEHPDVKEKKAEIFDILNCYQGQTNFTIFEPDVIYDGKNYFPTPRDHQLMLSCLANCDVSLSILSSQMIEASVFDKPAISIEFGSRDTAKYSINLKDFLTDHTERVFKSGAIYRIQEEHKLIPTIQHVLKHPDEKQKEREFLSFQEAPIHRGDALTFTLSELKKLID